MPDPRGSTAGRSGVLMLAIKPIASSSRGNCYHITDGSTPLLLECGLPFQKIRQALNFKLSMIRACLVTHEHKDLCRAVLNMLSAGIDCYMTAGTAETLDIAGHHRCQVVKAGAMLRVGTWQVMPFATIHDAAEPVGFLLGSGAERLLFVTDSAYIQHRFAGLTHIMIECNYDEQSLKANIANGDISKHLADRITQTHFSLENVLQMLNANDLSGVHGIWLMHLSDANADATRIKNKIQRVTGKPVFVCEV